MSRFLARFRVGTHWGLRWGAFGLLILLVPAAAATPEPPLERFEFEEPQMGVPFRIVLFAPDRAMAQRGATAAFDRIAEINGTLSNYETDSELSQLGYHSGSSRWLPVSQDLWRVLERSQILARLSGGAFDITVGPLTGLWRNARREHRLPSPERLARARSKSGWQGLRLNPATKEVALLHKGMRLDPGGIAKGFAIDEALRTISGLGIRRALVAGSGDIAVSRAPPGSAGWRIRLVELDEDAAAPEYLVLNQGAVATSGDLFQFLEIEGRRYSHILDPRTGMGLTNRILVTVVAPDCFTADSLATTLSVMGPDRSLPLLRRFPGSSARVLHMDSRRRPPQVLGAFPPSFTPSLPRSGAASRARPDPAGTPDQDP